MTAAKARGTVLGSARAGHWEGREAARLEGAKKGNAVSAQVRREKSMAAVADLLPTIKDLRTKGESLAAIAAHLTAAGHQTTRGSAWTAMAVKRILDRQK